MYVTIKNVLKEEIAKQCVIYEEHAVNKLMLIPFNKESYDIAGSLIFGSSST